MATSFMLSSILFEYYSYHLSDAFFNDDISIQNVLMVVYTEYNNVHHAVRRE